MKKFRLHRENWIEEAEAVIKNMSGADMSYFSDFIWCGNQVVDVWFYPDATCHFSINADTIQSIRTKDAEAFWWNSRRRSCSRPEDKSRCR